MNYFDNLSKIDNLEKVVAFPLLFDLCSIAKSIKLSFPEPLPLTGGASPGEKPEGKGQITQPPLGNPNDSP